ncbi:uncharacterized protein LOC130216329 [Danio aesculapii]|uniref:uncharacterized protein LOC130216329 n=1 Tax=Danio aesculapii TaxID=1142201 RepID=UPI0024C0D827|nr:uncharacterized protein LOC130216329 [Danio aesculapii]
MLYIFIIFCLCRLVDGVNVVSVMEGDSVTLHNDISTFPLYKMCNINWEFKSQQADVIHYKNNIYGNRVQMNNETGSLTISNIRITDSGLYKMFCLFFSESYDVTVYARLPNPTIFRGSLNSSSSNCSVLCSVLNVSAVSLSWYKGNSLLSRISVSDLSVSVSLHLEVEHQDKNTYSCVLNNSFTNRTEHLDITQLCQGSIHCCSFTEAVIRLVVAAVVCVAAVAIVVYDIISRRAEEKKRRRSQSVIE